MKKDLKKELIGLGINLAAGAVLTALAVNAMMESRGRFEFGGEWLIIPVILLLEYGIREVVEGIINMWDETADWLEDEEE